MNKISFTFSAAVLNVMCMTSCVFAEGSHEEGGMLPPFCSDLALWTTIIFFIVLIILWKFAWAPIMEGLDKREQYVQDQRSDAEKANAEARALLEEYKTQLANAKAEVQQMRADAQAAAEKASQVLMKKAMSDIEAEKKVATHEIASAKVQAQKELAAKSAELAVELAGTILQQKLDPKSHQQIINNAVAKFGK